MAFTINISALNFTAQIKATANGQPFSAWNMQSFEGLRETFLNWIYNLDTTGKTDKQREFGADFKRSPTSNFTIEEICLLWILVQDPAYLGLTESWADDFYLKIYERAKFNVAVTERKTFLSNELESYKPLAQKYPDGIVNKAPETNTTTTNPTKSPNTGTGSFSLWESIKAALQSPLVWLLFAYSFYTIIKKRRRKDD